MAILFRLSRIGNALPLSHLYPTGNGEHRRGEGAQCFTDLAEAAHEAKCGSMVVTPDRLLLIEVACDARHLPHDESGWAHVTADDVVAVRMLPLPTDPYQLLADYETDEEMWEAAEVVDFEWKETV